MSFSLDSRETVAEAVRRVMSEELDNAITLMRANDAHQDRRVHDTRKILKALRGVIRLTRGELDAPTFERENCAYRDCARLLAPAREAKAMLEAFDKLLSHYDGELSRRAFGPVRRRLERTHARVTAQSLEPMVIEGVVNMLEAARKRVDAWSLPSAGWRCISRGLRRTYRDGRLRYHRAMAEGTPENLHEWRKQVKYQWQQIRLLQKVWPAPLGARRIQLKKLSDILGDDHDLHELEAALSTLPVVLGESLKVQALLSLIQRRREELYVEASALGKQLFSESTSSFVKRFRGYFKVWWRSCARSRARQHALLGQVSQPAQTSADPEVVQSMGSQLQAEPTPGADESAVPALPRPDAGLSD